MLQHVVEFDSPESAREYLDVYRIIMKKKSLEHNELTGDDVNHIVGSTQAGKFELHISGSIVSSLEGIR